MNVWLKALANLSLFNQIFQLLENLLQKLSSRVVARQIFQLYWKIWSCDNQPLPGPSIHVPPQRPWERGWGCCIVFRDFMSLVKQDQILSLFNQAYYCTNYCVFSVGKSY